MAKSSKRNSSQNRSRSRDKQYQSSKKVVEQNKSKQNYHSDSDSSSTGERSPSLSSSSSVIRHNQKNDQSKNNHSQSKNTQDHSNKSTQKSEKQSKSSQKKEQKDSFKVHNSRKNRLRSLSDSSSASRSQRQHKSRSNSNSGSDNDSLSESQSVESRNGRKYHHGTGFHRSNGGLTHLGKHKNETFVVNRCRLRRQLHPKKKSFIFDFTSDEDEYNQEMEICYQKRNEQRKKIEQRELKDEELQRQKKVQNIKQQDERKHQELVKQQKENLIVMDEHESIQLQIEEDAEIKEENLEQGEEKQPKKIKKEKIKQQKTGSGSQSSSSSGSSDSSSGSENSDDEYAKEIKEKTEARNQKEEVEIEIGPVPLFGVDTIGNRAHYGDRLLPGEGTAMAQYISEGQRIPRRGQVGLTSEQIENYEKLGFVMSGSRHKRMTAVRQRKEAQVYSAQEQIALAIYQYEQLNKKETLLMENYKNMLIEKKRKD